MPTLKQQRAERYALIATLGWTPEPEHCPPAERYCATTGELWELVAKRFGTTVANNCRLIAATALLALLLTACGGVVRGPNPDDLHDDLGTGGATAELGAPGGAGGSDTTSLQDFDYCVTRTNGEWVETECAGWCFSNTSDAGLYANDFCFTSQAGCTSYRQNIVDQLGDTVSSCVEL